MFARLCDVDPGGRSWNVCDSLTSRLSRSAPPIRDRAAGQGDSRGVMQRPATAFGSQRRSTRITMIPAIRRGAQ
ncbi:MAG TPA: hypothetical protein VMK13_15705, partial [Streptosporangiaceae bacterium]|nr:hypothetical protein [Streptosporangiaceae bacterium]